jgi:hypothetical protein
MFFPFGEDGYNIEDWSERFLVVKLNFYLFKAVKHFFRKQKWIQKN